MTHKQTYTSFSASVYMYYELNKQMIYLIQDAESRLKEITFIQ